MMKHEGLNPFSAGAGIVAGTLVGLSLFVLVQSGDIKKLNASYTPIRLYSLQASPVNIEEFFSSDPAMKDSPELPEFLSDVAARTEGRQVTILELSREDEVTKLLTPILDFQQQSDAKHDVIVYLAPSSLDRKAEMRMGDAVKTLLQSRAIQYPLINRRTTYIFHSQLKNWGYSLEKIVNFAHEKRNFPQYGLMHIQLDGDIDQIAWVRTTLGRWNVVSKDFSESHKISTALIDPSRNTITTIDF